jgi:type VI secretion system protein
MSLILMIQDHDMLENGESGQLELDRHGAVIGRSAHADWSLPDARNHISSRHCEISYRDGVYLLADRSTNGTFLNGSPERLTAPHPLADGDRIQIGRYEIVARCDEAPAAAPAPVAASGDGWGEWDAPAASGWGDAPAGHRQDAARVAPPLPGGGWDTPAPLSKPSPWSSEPRESGPPSASDIWGELARQSEIDRSRGGFGPVTEAAQDWGTETPVAPDDWADAAASTPAAAAPADPADGWAAFLAGTGLPPDMIRSAPRAMLANAGAILRQMVAGLVLMVEARARAKAQLGLQATSLELDGNNPLKFVRAPERALLQLLEPPERGFMGASRAVEDAFEDLQAHQMATLSAMRGALDATLARFSPAAIRARRRDIGGLSRLLPHAREAALWQAYEREFEGVVRGADEAFMDMFAKEFRTAYEAHCAEMRDRRRADG